MAKAEGERLRRAREALHWERRELAGLLGLNKMTIYAYERGTRAVPEGLADWLEDVARGVKRVIAGHPPPLIVCAPWKRPVVVRREAVSLPHALPGRLG